VEPIRYFNRHTGTLETEQVYGEGFLRWTYGHPLGAISLNAFVKRPFFSAWYGRRMSTSKSASRVSPFISQYGLADGKTKPTPLGTLKLSKTVGTPLDVN
jgi:phosphatidylserine decarboxylase